MSNSQNYKRLDVWLVDNKYFSSRNVASNAISLGSVSVNGEVVQKSSAKITQFDVVTIDISEKHYVSRAANKLKYLVTKTKIDIERKLVLTLVHQRGALRKYFSNSVPQKSMRLMLVTSKWLISSEKINE